MTQDEVKQQMRETPEGKFLLKAGFEPYNTESSARRVAEFAVKEFVEQQKQLATMRDILREVQIAFNKGDTLHQMNALKMVDFYLTDNPIIAWNYVFREEMEAKLAAQHDAFIKCLKEEAAKIKVTFTELLIHNHQN